MNATPRENTWLPFLSETPYQVVMIAAMLELLLLAALAPRTNGDAPLCFESVSGLRLFTLLLLGVMVGSGGQQRGTTRNWSLARSLEPALPLLIWGLMLLPPELWAFALEARAGFPISSGLSIALGIGCAAALRLHRRLGWLFPLGIISVLVMRGFSLTLPSPTLLALAAGGVALLLWKTP